MTSSLANVVDRVDRESYESFRRLAKDLWQSIDSFAFNKTAAESIELEIPASCRTARQKAEWAEHVYLTLDHFIEDDIAAVLPATNKLHANLKDSMSGMAIAHVTSREVASMSKGKCMEALLLACELICDQDKILALRNAKYTAEAQRLNTKIGHEKLFYGEARKPSQALSQLRNGPDEKTEHSTQSLRELRRELEEKTKQCDDLTNGINAAADRLRTLGSDCLTSKPVPADHKEPELPPQLEAAIADVKQILDSERKKTKRLHEQVKYFKKKLDAVPEPDSSNNVKDLQAELDAARAEASAAKNTANELAEKLRCQICMDRQRDTAFACGHTCCKQCSVKWEKCTFNCVSERRQKPVKFTFPLYFN